MPTIEDVIQEDLKLDLEFVTYVKATAKTRVKRFTIPKRSGGIREISHPAVETKTIQYWLIHNIFSHMQLHDSAYAYRSSISTKDMAMVHQKNRYFLKLDFTDFFPSISFEDFSPYLEKWNSANITRWDQGNAPAELICSTCFDKDDRLSIGFPSSPIISNIVMFDLDEIIQKTVLEIAKDGIYTRYADDIIISTNEKGACKEFFKQISKVITHHKSPCLSINPGKTKFSSSSGGSALVTGIRITQDHKLTIHRNHKDHIRLLLSLLRKGKLDPTEYESLLGHLNYVSHVDPVFYTKLYNKHYNEIEKIKASL